MTPGVRLHAPAAQSSVTVRACVLPACAALLLAGGCSSARVLVPSDNDGLRREVQSLREQVTTLEAQRTELQQQLAAATAATTGAATDGSASDPEVLEATPQLVRIDIEAGSHVQRASEGSCTAVIYLKPSDGRGRFMQIVGRARASAFQLHADGRVASLGSAQWSPLQVRDAWRGGLFGAHYTLRLPLAAEGWTCDGTGAVTVRAEFTSLPDGKSVSVQREIPTGKE